MGLVFPVTGRRDHYPAFMDAKQTSGHLQHEKHEKAPLFPDALATAQLLHPMPLVPPAVEAMMLVGA